VRNERIKGKSQGGEVYKGKGEKNTPGNWGRGGRKLVRREIYSKRKIEKKMDNRTQPKCQGKDKWFRPWGKVDGGREE